jgi:molecular chaperone GrpE
MLTTRHMLRREFPLPTTRLTVSFSQKQNGRDIMSMASESLRENERLHHLAQELETRRDRPEEAERLIKSLLPTLDGFDRVLHLGRSYPQNDMIDNWLKSVESIYFRLLNTLENFGLFQMRTVGSKVDLNLHEVVEYRPAADHANDTIISERQKGYILNGKLLRDAKVVVAYNERSQ